MATRIVSTGKDGMAIIRPVTRETQARDPSHGQILMVKLGPYALEIWCKKRRRKFAVAYQDVYRLAVKMAQHAIREEKLLARKRRKR